MSQRLHIFTSAAVNYLPKVRALCRSIRKHHPEAVIHLALADERPPWLTTGRESFDSILELSDLGIPRWRGWSFGHTIVELSTAIKPFALRHLLARPDCARALYIDPDIVVFSRLDDILAMLETANVALTPHQAKPERTYQSVLDNEVTSLRMGVFNLGFIGVNNTPEARRFADWWSERCYQFCRAEVHNGFFTDQKWINFAPIYFEGVEIVRAPRHNVATWNLTTRSLTGDFRDGFRVDGEPLGFYHFTGFDSGAHRIMAVKNAAGNSAVQELIAWYERETQPAPGDPANDWPWAFGRFSDGTPVMPAHRWVYRERKDLQATFPDPYDNTSEGLTYFEWCDTEGRLRFPEYFGKPDGPAPMSPFPSGGSIPLPIALRLFMLLFAPRGGRSLRARFRRMLRAEGLGGIARRLRRHEG